MKLKPIFAWYDLWVGVFWDGMKRRLYVFPLPMLGVVVQFKSEVAKTFTNFWHEHATWSRTTFGQDRGPTGAIKHLQKECLEVLAAPDDLEEYADCQLLLFDACRRAGFTDEQLLEACYRKLAKNKARKWGKIIPGEPVLHIE